MLNMSYPPEMGIYDLGQKSQFLYTTTSPQQLENFLFRTILGFHLDNHNLPAGPIPLVPDIIVGTFKAQCLQQATDFNCLYTSKAVYILEELLAERAVRSYVLAQEIGCPILAKMAVERFSSTLISSQWFTEFCTSHGLRLLNPQSLEQLRKKHCTKMVLEKFYHFLQVTVHQIPHLLYNMDETSCCTNKRGNIVVPEGKYPFVSEERSVGHITMCCTSHQFSY